MALPRFLLLLGISLALASTLTAAAAVAAGPVDDVASDTNVLDPADTLAGRNLLAAQAVQHYKKGYGGGYKKGYGGGYKKGYEGGYKKGYGGDYKKKGYGRKLAEADSNDVVAVSDINVLDTADTLAGRNLLAAQAVQHYKKGYGGGYKKGYGGGYKKGYEGGYKKGYGGDYKKKGYYYG